MCKYFRGRDHKRHPAPPSGHEGLSRPDRSGPFRRSRWQSRSAVASRLSAIRLSYQHKQNCTFARLDAAANANYQGRYWVGVDTAAVLEYCCPKIPFA